MKHNFIPGEEWLYYKIYCGVETTDTVLNNCIKPLVNSFFKKNIITKWFFIRYSDPENHLRVRFLLKDTRDLGLIITEIQKKLHFFIESKQIWNIQIDSYKREIERYGLNSIEKAESYFFNDSTMVLNIIKEEKNDEVKFIKTVEYIKLIINLFEFSEKELLHFLSFNKEKFRREFNADKNTNKFLSKLYRNLKFQSSKIEKKQEIKSQKEIVNWFLKLKSMNELEVSLESLLSSFIHMTFNRVFNSEQRMYEMVFYDFYFINFKSKILRNEVIQ
ncbi:thiopeptide-type bacteriocin biosynthesis protein [uncultured Tenacibaculum sp.]|uniref:thiopeptide-type bacteriocin biosynthesis protein n=1 Tax=uncultured Tenacibaculum sp. TaxID=174713 RepID=UPI002634AF0B|nr:thiopeptide-type bacteriocin biosynthesis protein [uncultured Tenacibaculum sp.]